MVDIIHRVGIRAAISQVNSALSSVEGVAGWWTRDTSGSSKIGGTVEVRFHSADGKEIGSMKMEGRRARAQQESAVACYGRPGGMGGD